MIGRVSRMALLRSVGQIAQVAAIAWVSMLSLAIGEVSAAAQFGTRCQSDFEDNWAQEIPYAYTTCSGFNDQLDNSETLDFYVDLRGDRLEFHDFWDGPVGSSQHFGNDHSPFHEGSDTVDLLYVFTHGGTDRRLVTAGSTAVLTGWEDDKWIYSGLMRLGDDDDQLRVLSINACGTLKIDDLSYKRWIPAFSGGLQLVTGSHGKLRDGWTLTDTGENYAAELQDGVSVRWAWFDGLWDWYADQDVAVYATGRDESDCLHRLSNLSWHNMSDFDRLRDDAIEYMCASWITDH